MTAVRDEPIQRHRFDFGSLLEAAALPVVWIVMAIFFSVVPKTHHTFPTLSTIGTITGIGAVTVVLALAVMFPITGGDYDLSVAATLTLAGMLVAILNVNFHVPIFYAIVLSVAAGALIGAINGAVTVLTEIDPFIITLGTGTIIDGIALLISNQSTIVGVSPGLSRILIIDRLLGQPLDFYFAVSLAVVVWFVLNFLPYGRHLLYIGMGREVARLSGVPVRLARFWAFVLAGTMSALAGIIYTGLAGSADPSSGNGLLLPAYAAVMLGATTIRPGRFNPWGALIAVYFLGTGVTGLELLGASNYVQDLFYGFALVIAVVFSTTVRRQRNQRQIEQTLRATNLVETPADGDV